MKIGSLFSGIGGLELGLEWSGIGETVFQVEINDFCRSVLAKHWPNVERFEDVKEVGAHNLPKCDLICGGFPCQDLSTAGRKAGLDGEKSGLWFEFKRIISELAPRFVVVENVGHSARQWVDLVRVNLAELGYASIPVKLEARFFGLRHRRARVFIIADAHSFKLRLQQRRGRGASGEVAPLALEPGEEPRWNAQPSLCRVDDGISRGLDKDRLRALGNAVVPQAAQLIGALLLSLLDDVPRAAGRSEINSDNRGH